MFQPRGIKLLAEKVETKEEFDQAAEMGYTYFQGYFFSKPVIISGKDIPGFKLTYLQMLQEINSPEMDFRKIEDLIKREVSVSYKLLRYINSAFFGLRRKVESIRQALALLGERNIKKWISLIALSSMGEDKPMAEILDELSISEDIKVALSGGENRFRDVYETILAYEKGDWEQFSVLATKLGLDEAEVPNFHFNSVELTNQIFSMD